MKKFYLPIVKQSVETVILANGKFPSHPISVSILNNCRYLVCCDGAVNNLSQASKVPDAIVGDCDSLSVENKLRFESIIHCMTDQETNDLTKAVNFCLNQGRDRITILGATGKREDHTLANISLLHDYTQFADVEMITDYGVFSAIKISSMFESVQGQQVSLFTINQPHVTTTGLKYPINNQSFTNLWQATLNEALADEFVVLTDGVTIVYRLFT